MGAWTTGLLVTFGVLAAGFTTAVRAAEANSTSVTIPPGVVQLFVDDHLIGAQDGLKRTLRQPRKDNGGNVPLLAPPELQTLMASGTVVYDPRLKKHVMFAQAFREPPQGRYQVTMYRFTSPDAMNWTAGDDGKLEEITFDLRDAATGRSATNIDTFSCWYDKTDVKWPYKGWLYFANWGDDLEGIFYVRSADGRAWERGRQVVNAWAGGEDPSCREIRQDGRILKGPNDVTLFSYDPIDRRFLGIFKFLSAPGGVGPNNHLRSRAYAFFDRLDEPFDTARIERIALLPPAEERNGDKPHDEYYASTAWRYGSLWLGGLKVWHGGGDYPYSAAGCAFLKLVVSRDGLHWAKVPFVNDSGIAEVFIANGPEGGNGGKNDGGYLTEFSQGPLRIGDELIYYYGCSSWGKNGSRPKRISGGGIFRARLRPDGFVSVDAGSLTTRPLKCLGENLFVNGAGPIRVDVMESNNEVRASFDIRGDSLRHPVRFEGRSLRTVAADGPVRLRFTVSEGGQLYAFVVE